MDDFYVNLSSKATVFTKNSANNFTVQFKPEIPLNGTFHVALVEIFMPTPKIKKLKAKYLLANFISSSIVGESSHRLLKVIYSYDNHVQFSSEYIKVTDSFLDTLTFEFVDDESNRIEFEEGNVEIRLHFMKKW